MRVANEMKVVNKIYILELRYILVDHCAYPGQIRGAVDNVRTISWKKGILLLLVHYWRDNILPSDLNAISIKTPSRGLPSQYLVRHLFWHTAANVSVKASHISGTNLLYRINFSQTRKSQQA